MRIIDPCERALFGRVDRPVRTGDFHGGTTSKNVLRDALRLELRALNRTAGVIAEADGNPGLMNHFRMPYGVDDVTLCARAMAQAAPLFGKFTDLGLADTFLDDLETHVTALESADTDQNEGEETRSGATANFGPLLREALAKVKSLDAIIRNFHRSHSSKLGA